MGTFTRGCELAGGVAVGPGTRAWRGNNVGPWLSNWGLKFSDDDLVRSVAD